MACFPPRGRGLSWQQKTCPAPCVDNACTARLVGDESKTFCYTAPQFNIWRSFCEALYIVPYTIFPQVKISISSTSKKPPSVFSASEDDIHGLVDHYIKVGGSSMLGSDLGRGAEQRRNWDKGFIRRCEGSAV
eukprot:749465-Hanusia_phi.AAC.7